MRFSLDHLYEVGDVQNASGNEAWFRLEAEQTTTSALLAWDQWPDYPPGTYGRVFVLGKALIEATSWEDVKGLVCGDHLAWLSGLSDEKRVRAEAVLPAEARLGA